MIRLPVRIDLLGGWSDQTAWTGPAAVLNAAIGWDGGYPLTLDDEGRLHSEIVGVGTGLGVSSILQAGRFLQANPHGDYVNAVLEWEAAQGTCGGWQDQIGGITPGMKLCGPDHGFIENKIGALPWPEPRIWPHLVLFDTGIRRQSREIGDVVRKLMQGWRRDPCAARDDVFCAALRRNVQVARALYEIPNVVPETFALECIEGWQRLVRCVPSMAVDVPAPPHCWGHKLVGAGGGGFGLFFVREAEARPEVLKWLDERGVWAKIPELLDGVQISG